MQIIPVNRVVDPKRTIEKMEGQGEGEAQGVAYPPPPPKKNQLWLHCRHSFIQHCVVISIGQNGADLIKFPSAIYGAKIGAYFDPLMTEKIQKKFEQNHNYMYGQKTEELMALKAYKVHNIK
jgi:hypothetical protein